MRSRILVAAALAALLPAGCHEDDTLVFVIVAPSAPFSITANGGSASASDGSAVGNGGNGGVIIVTAAQNASIGGATLAPTPPTPPSPPTAGTVLTATDLMADVSQPGNLIINSTVTISGGGSPRSVTATTGDIVVSGILIAEDPGAGATNGISLSAPNGTIYVTGIVSTVNTDGTPDGDDAGAISLSALRIVVTGTLEAYAEDHPGGSGGNGGAIMVTATGVGDVFFTSGTITASGGAAIAGAGGTGDGGAVTLTAAGQVHAYGTITSRGGRVTGSSGGEVGGNGGTLTFNGGTAVDLDGTLDTTGGRVTTSGAGATGGNGGAISFDGPVLRVYGDVTFGGGSASAATGPGITGGNASIINVGMGNAVDVELGRGTYGYSGGDGAAQGGAGGTFAVTASDGAIVFGSEVVAVGGNGVGAGPAAGGNGGSVSLISNSPPGSEDPVTLLEEASIDNSGGGGVGGGGGGDANGISFITSGALQSLATIRSVGGDSAAGSAGDASNLTFQVNTLGDLEVGGSIVTSGGSGLAGGASGVVMVTNNALTGNVVLSANITSVSGTGVGGPAGVTGLMGVSAANGDVFLSGTHLFRGGTSDMGPSMGTGYTVTTTSAGSITSSAVIDTGGGGSIAASSSNVAGADAGDVSFTVNGVSDLVTLQPGSFISAVGGASTGTSVGGTGGDVSISTVDQAVSISGTISVRGGQANGSGGIGGAGGSVVVDSDSDANGTGGNITLAAGSIIDASGGNGTTQGSALSDMTPASVMAGMIAVDFDADGGTDSANGGRISQQGIIVAAGGAFGGDVHFDGFDAAGADPPVAGTQTLTGTSPGDFVGD